MKGFEQEELALSNLITSQSAISKMYLYVYPESDHNLMRKSLEIAIKVPLDTNVLKKISDLQGINPVEVSILFSVLFIRTRYQDNPLGVGDPISSVRDLVYLLSSDIPNNFYRFPFAATANGVTSIHDTIVKPLYDLPLLLSSEDFIERSIAEIRLEHNII
jgi:hypothetical protein